MNNRLNGLLELYKKDPDDSFVIYGIALEYKSKRNYTEAENYFTILVEKDPTYVPVYMQFAILKEEINEINRAKELYTEGIKIAKQKGDTHAIQEMEDFLNELD